MNVSKMLHCSTLNHDCLSLHMSFSSSFFFFFFFFFSFFFYFTLYASGQVVVPTKAALYGGERDSP